MRKQGCFAVIFLSCSLLTGCLGGVWTGATLVYDRHNVYKKLSDYELSAEAHRVLYEDNVFKTEGCAIDLAVFNGDILLAGHVPSLELRETAIKRISALSGYRRLFNQMDISQQPSNTLEDSWITTKVRSQIFADSAIDPNAFKVITSDRIVYLMGDVRPAQAAVVINIARNTAGVERVVKLLKYYNLSGKPVKDV
ncbi:hemolysin, lipoprotein [Legionella donaldsonii]|uniref:Hemolysin, lipoprotein n=1 Tax=Legionella donaldsonii TaxID=45060 RepID=A0A378JCN0_9GAMM|nr:BON domain-containing protein [Legionella donaldsonii]STX45086.1 hemolysin, lipoprotein [Legionella donaldsonii]